MPPKPCPGCESSRAQVARLEAAIRAKDAALREEQSHWRAALTAWKGNETIDIDYSSGLAAEARLTAALSDTAGEGWLPPEAREQDIEAAIYFVEQAKTTHEEWAVYIVGGGELPEQAGDLERHQEYIQEYEHVLAVLRAVLDALGGE